MDLVTFDPTPTKVGKIMLTKGIIARSDKNIKILNLVQFKERKGKALKDLDNNIQIAAWIRVFD